MHRYLLFDLDGTLTDPAEGITKCVQYALSYFGQAERRPEELYCYIGPPLPESFETYGGLSREEALLAVEKYRERFREKGMFENKVYPVWKASLDAERRWQGAGGGYLQA